VKNREIKFRAWDKFEKKMIQPHDGDFIRWHAMSNWKDCLELMQYTGLKDKNGREIYEGDVIKWDEQEWGAPYRELVEWDYCLFDMRNNDWNEWCEVIGDIYSNPELLTEEHNDKQSDRT